MTDSVEAYPLQWPDGWPRTKSPQRSRFQVSLRVARDELVEEIRRLGGRSVVISTNLKVRLDGLPYATQRMPDDPGVAVYFTLKGRQQCIPCDRWSKVQDNLQAIRKTVEALRGLERWGAKHMVDAAFRGFEALPGTSEQDWWRVLGFDGPQATRESIRDRYRELVRLRHPDKGGSHEEMQRLNDAYAAALRSFE